MPLLYSVKGEQKIISDFKCNEDMKRHLRDLGFVPGETVKIVGENASGLILIVKGVRLALNRALASKIMVQ